MSVMTKLNSNGSLATPITIVVESLLLVIFIILTISSFRGEQHYKNNVNTLVNQQISGAIAAQQQKDAQAAAEASKNPLTTYNGSPTYGSVVLQYPKTWSAYIDDSGSGSALIDGYFMPGHVPSINSASGSTNFALRLQVSSQKYSDLVNGFSSDPSTSVVPYSFPKQPNAVGVKVTGNINQNNKTGTMVLVQLRDKTIILWTESGDFLNDFNNYVLPYFNFSP